MRIQCPECSENFDVTEDFLGQAVECGTCENQFTITEDLLFKEKAKSYPGEKKEGGIRGFNKPVETMSVPAGGKGGFGADINVDSLGFTSPGKILASLLGIVILVGAIAIFLLIGREGGEMRDMETPKRFIIMGFAALLGGGLLCYGTTRNKKLGWPAACILGLSALGLPVLFPGNPMSGTVVENIEELDAEVIVKVSEVQSVEDYLVEIGYEPVRRKIASSQPNTVVGIYLRNASESEREQIANYVYSATDKISREILYDRGVDGLKGLILLTEQKKSLNEFAEICERFGKIEKIDRVHRIIDMTVLPGRVGSLEGDAALNPDHINYEVQNFKALQSIDPGVQLNAVKRLAVSEPKALRSDITRAMLVMLPKSDRELKIEIIRALAVWSQAGDGSEELVFDSVKQLLKSGDVEKGAIEFLIERKVDGVELIIMELWKKNPAEWSETFISIGQGAEIILLPRMESLSNAQAVDACGILGKVGTRVGLDYLVDELSNAENAVVKKSIQAAIDEIKNRL